MLEDSEISHDQIKKFLKNLLNNEGYPKVFIEHIFHSNSDTVLEALSNLMTVIYLESGKELPERFKQHDRHQKMLKDLEKFRRIARMTKTQMLPSYEEYIQKSIDSADWTGRKK